MASECSVCCEVYNRTTRKQITCGCGFSACKSCVRTYLLNTELDPHCMSCRKGWNQQFIVEQLNRSFITNDYKNHRQKLLCDQEISKIPDTMEAANRTKKAEEELDKYRIVQQEIKCLHEQLHALQQQSYKHQRLASQYKNQKAHEKRQFIMPCPGDNCRGFLSTKYKCELCHLQTCAKCLEIKTSDEHVCLQENIDSANLIRQDTKPCPACGTRIYKISGCDQMWCSQCHKAFSWKTGRIETGTIHNPHFYEYQRNNNNGVAPRVPGDVVCGGLASRNDLRLLYNIVCSGNQDLAKNILNIHRFISHVTNWEITQTRDRILQYTDTEHWRIEYILQKISKEQLTKALYRNDNQRRKLGEILNIFELVEVVGIEMFRRLTASIETLTITAVKKEINDYGELRDYCNEQFQIVQNTYKQNVPHIFENWKMSEHRY